MLFLLMNLCWTHHGCLAACNYNFSLVDNATIKMLSFFIVVISAWISLVLFFLPTVAIMTGSVLYSNKVCFMLQPCNATADLVFTNKPAIGNL
jgi:hypothetical protein